MTGNLYDAIRYTTYPRIETHPDRLATVGTLHGMAPAPVSRCRVLEIGCGDGGNLVPMAYFLPASRFTGIDLAESAIAQARTAIAALELTNVTVTVNDVRALGRDAGEFDYIFAHGLYSWIPPEVRETLIRLCSELLSPEGIAFISYNTLPGRRDRHHLRKLLLQYLRDVPDPRGRIVKARRFLGTVGTPEAAAMAASADDILFHDDLAPINDPISLEEFTAHAQRHGLQYLGDADAGRSDAFRQTLLCRREVKLRRDFTSQEMDRFHFSLRPEGPAIQGDAAVTAVAEALRDTYPLPVAFAELEPYAGGAGSLREILDSLVRGGSVNLHVHDFPCEESVTERPRATRLARYQAKESNFVTSVCHCLVELTAADRKLIQKLDGTRKLRSPAIAWMAQMGLLEG